MPTPIFSEQSLRELKRDHDRLERTLEGLTRRLAGMRCELQSDLGFYLVKMTAGASARSGTTPGSTSGYIWKYNGSTIENTALEIQIYNPFASTSGAANTYVLVAIDCYGTAWITSEDCP